MQRKTVGMFLIMNWAVRLTLRRTDGLQAGRRQTVRCSFISGYNGSFKNSGVI